MERLFDLDAQLLNDAVLLAIAVFFLFLIMSNMLFNPARKLLKDRKEALQRILQMQRTIRKRQKS